MVLSDIAARLVKLAGPRPKVLLAFSGGVDSTLLAHALVLARRKLDSLRLAHVDHGLQSASKAWSRQCARQARRWRVPFVALRADISRRPGESPEARAREARYAVLAAAMQSGEVLVTAQHRDDQVETLLLQLLRGAGVAGLAAMPAIASFEAGRIARPLLDVSRADIERMAREARLSWIEDPTNADTRYSRNFVRRRVLPLLREHWPGADRALARTAAHMAEAAALLQERAMQDLAAAADGAGLSVAALRALPAARRRNALRGFIALRGAELPDSSRLREMCGPLLAARADAQPEVRWSGGAMRRRAGRLELDTSPEVAVNIAVKSWPWDDHRRLILDDGARLELRDDKHGPIDLDRLPSTLELRPRAGGERLRPGPRARSQPLKKLLQAAGLTVEERARLPLLFTGKGPKGRLIAVGDRWIDASIAATVKSRRRARLQWTRKKGVGPI